MAGKFWDDMAAHYRNGRDELHAQLWNHWPSRSMGHVSSMGTRETTAETPAKEQSSILDERLAKATDSRDDRGHDEPEMDRE